MPEKRPSTAIVALSVAPRDLIAEVQAIAGHGARVDEAVLDAAKRGSSVNTRRAFRSDLTLWGQWCRHRHILAHEAAPKDVAAWIRALAGMDLVDIKIRAMATIERYLVHISWAHRMAGLTDPTADPVVKFERKAARNHLGVRQRQARGIRFKGDIADLDSPATGVCLAHLLKAYLAPATMAAIARSGQHREGTPAAPGDDPLRWFDRRHRHGTAAPQ